MPASALTGWRREEGRLVLQLHVQPGARRTEAAGVHGGRLKVRLAARAVDGAANDALVQFLAGEFGVPRRQVLIEAGARARHKRVAVLAPLRLPSWLGQA
jgi:hypothetical protein